MTARNSERKTPCHPCLTAMSLNHVKPIETTAVEKMRDTESDVSGAQIIDRVVKREGNRHSHTGTAGVGESEPSPQ
jgi:hypothetical protein